MVRSYLQHVQTLSSNVKIFMIGNAIQGMGLSIYTLLFNLYLKELGYGESSIGSLISTTSLGISLMAIPAAFIVERFHVKHLVLTGMLVCSIFYSTQIFNTSEASLFGFGLLASMFQALYSISVSPFYLRNSTPAMRVHLFSLNSSLNMGVQILGYLFGGYLPEIVRFFYPGLEKFEQYRYSMLFALSIVLLSNVAFMQIKKVPIPKIRKKMFEGLREREWKTIGRLILPKLCIAFGSGLIVPFLNIYLKERFNFSTKMIGISYAALQVFIFVGIFVNPSIMKRVSQLKFIMITSFLAIPFIVIMGMTGNVGFVLSCFFMRGMLMNMSSPIISIFEMERVQEKECLFASAIITSCYHFVYTTSTRLGGMLIEEYSFGPTFYVAGFSYATSIFLYYKFFYHEEKSKQSQRIETCLPAEQKAA